MPDGVICLLTIHGIGFEQPPTADGTPGYADGLHAHLQKQLGAGVLANDPLPGLGRSGQSGPIYIEGCWPPTPDNISTGLDRLGTWSDPYGKTRLVAEGKPLVTNGCRLAHVALVYSREEDRVPHIGALLTILAMVVLALRSYATRRGLLAMLSTDVAGVVCAEMAARRPTLHPAAPVPRRSSLRVRTDIGSQRDTKNPTGLVATLRTVEDDVAAYVCHNEMRERVRDFVREAIFRLAARDDVAGIVVNAHSNGTVVAFDVLRQLRASADEDVKGFVTAGSPLRKYTTFFHWGDQVTRIYGKDWLNFWDPADPVADPLRPPASWRRGLQLPPASAEESRYAYVKPETAESCPMLIQDTMIDNVRRSTGGGLQAHNYWDNESEFIAPFAQYLQGVLARPATPTPG